MSRLVSAFSPIKNLKHLFHRPSSNFSVIDGFRALSMMMILVFHSFTIFVVMNPALELNTIIETGGLAWSWVWNSDKSVDVFFVISGFLITGILLRQIDKLGHIRMGNFYWRRFLRLSPVYYFVIILYWLLLGHSDNSNTHNLWTNILYLNNFVDYDDQAMNWTWTLAIEEQFYLLFPLLLMAMMKYTKHPLRWMWGLFAFSFIVRGYVIYSDEMILNSPQSLLAVDREFHAHHFSVLYDNLYTRYGALLAGCLAGYYYQYYRVELSRLFASGLGKALAWGSFGVLVLLMVVPVISVQFDEYQGFNIAYQIASRNIFSLTISVLIIASLEKGALSTGLNFLLGNRLWYPLAQLSYSMYLVHVVAISVVCSMVLAGMKAAPEQYINWSTYEIIGMVFVASSLLTIFTAVVIYLLIERPIMNLRR
ncbi:hypothetical protein A9Q99_26245 [Gammaproteobacteria bacterium 45_16_T64]|nr:hypothetical protein A9Q99_26245 [Gammaproteobacteria bacterium 45_16_T64]